MQNLKLTDIKAEREQIRQEIRASWRQILRTMTAPAKRNVNGETSYICPICGHGKGGDGLTRNPESKDGNGIKCFGCGFSGDIIDLYQATTGETDYNNALAALAGKIGKTLPGAGNDQATPKTDRAERAESIETDTRQGNTPLQAETPESAAESATAAPLDFRPYYEACSCGKLTAETAPEAIAYLNARGISEKTAAAYNIGYDPAADPASAPGGNGEKRYPEPRVIIPCTNSFYIARATDPGAAYKAPNPKGSHTQLFNTPVMYHDKDAGREAAEVVFVVEGVFDALSIIECGFNAIALNGKGNGKLLTDRLQKQPTDASFVILPDNDDGKTGEDTIKQAQELARSLRDNGYNVSIETLQYHDANDAIKADRRALSTFLVKAEQDILEKQTDDITEFLNKIQGESYKPHATGLNFFDDFMNGGLIAQTLTLLLAAPGAGKTTLLAQIAESMAANKMPVIYLNLEMSREQMLAKAISARLNQAGHNYSSTNILQGYKWTDADRDIITNEILTYKREQFPYIKYNPGNVGTDLQTILDYLKRAGELAEQRGEQAPAVVLDYLHLVTGGDNDPQERIKHVVKGLKDYAVQYNTFAIAITAINRESMKDGKITLHSGRDSSNLEYTADIQFSLNWKEVDAGNVKVMDPVAMNQLKREQYWPMILRSLKNRGEAESKPTYIYFDPAHNVFYGKDDFMKHNGSTPLDDPGEYSGTIRL